MSSDLRILVRRLRRQGWTAEITKGGHRRFTSPEGEVVFGPFSPSDHRAIRNMVARLRRAGARI